MPCTPAATRSSIAAVSQAGGIGIVQPLSLIYVYRYDFREGIRKIKALTQKPFGMNVIVEKNAKIYEERMRNWVDIALEEGCRFFVTALGNPKWVIDKVKAKGGIIYHDVTEQKWAKKVAALGVDGLICVNNRAGGHAGTLGPRELFDQLSPLKLPLICAGGIGNEVQFSEAMKIGYAGVQMGTRFIATTECASHHDYKQAIVEAGEGDIVLTERVTGIPLSVIRSPYVDKVGLKVGPLGRFLFNNRRTRHWTRTFYNLRALRAMKRSSLMGVSTKDYYQAGRSVSGIDKVEPVQVIIQRFVLSQSS